MEFRYGWHGKDHGREMDITCAFSSGHYLLTQFDTFTSLTSHRANLKGLLTWHSWGVTIKSIILQRSQQGNTRSRHGEDKFENAALVRDYD